MSNQIIHSLEPFFHPRSVAVAGITISNPQHWSRVFFDSLCEFEFEGPFYAVNPKGGEIRGIHVYRSIEEIPGPVDYVISTVPASAAPGLVERCARKGVRAIHFCTSGFAETGEEEAMRLERELAETSRRTGVRILGPNCMGIYCPESRLSFGLDFPRESGSVGFITQSGGNAIALIRESMLRGVRFSKVISYGNACDLNESDFLEYLIDDPGTGIIALYLEGVADGKRFRRLLQKAADEKVVVLLKAGTTQSGARAVVGHTGALAGQHTTWEALCRQVGLIQVGSLEELSDVLVTLLFMAPPKGGNVCLIGSGGGASVLIADLFESNGLNVPPLPQDLVDRIREFTPPAGNILRNPIDYGQTMVDTAKLLKTVDMVSRWDGIDSVIAFIKPTQHLSTSLPRMLMVSKALMEGRGAIAKPMAIVFVPSLVPEEAGKIFPVLQQLAASGMPVYYSLASAAKAIGLVRRYHETHPSRPGR